MAAGGGVCGSAGSASRSAVLKAPGDSRKLWRPGLSLAGVRDCSRADRGPSRGERALSFSAGEKLSLVVIRTRGFPVNPQPWTGPPTRPPTRVKSIHFGARRGVKSGTGREKLNCNKNTKKKLFSKFHNCKPRANLQHVEVELARFFTGDPALACGEKKRGDERVAHACSARPRSPPYLPRANLHRAFVIFTPPMLRDFTVRCRYVRCRYRTVQ